MTNAWAVKNKFWRSMKHNTIINNMVLHTFKKLAKRMDLGLSALTTEREKQNQQSRGRRKLLTVMNKVMALTVTAVVWVST